jgi:hypothetical protein
MKNKLVELIQTMKSCKRKLFKLRRFYKRKMHGFTFDIYYDRCDGMRKSDILVEKNRITLPNGIEGIICLYDVDSFMGKTAFGLKYDILGYVGVKPIRNCNFFEFLKLYGSTILDGRN